VIAAWFRLALLLYPRRFRDRFEDSMIETLSERLRERQRQGPLAAIVFVVSATANLAWIGVSERLDERRRKGRSQRRSSTMSPWISFLLKETRFALRSLRKRPAFTLTAVATLALGVGANTAIFSVVKGVLLDPLPFSQPERLVTVINRLADEERTLLWSLSEPDLKDMQSGLTTIEKLVGYNVTNMTLTELGEPEVVDVARVTNGLLETFRVVPFLGRDLDPSELGPEGPAVAVVGYGFWSSRLGGKEDAVGRLLNLNGSSYEIVGVAPEGFFFPERIEIWIPVRNRTEDCGRGCHFLIGIGRIGKTADLDSARLELDGLASSLETTYPDTNTRKRFYARTLQDQIVGNARPGLLLILAAVGLLVLIACANVSSLLLVRASARTEEMAIRSAMGASRGRLVAQTLLESFLLALAGGALGLLVAASSLDLLLRLSPALPRIESVAIDLGVFLFALGTLVFVTLLVGVAPAFLTARASLRSGLAAAGDPGRQRFRNGLLTFETALAAVLLVGAGLLLKSFAALYTVDPGFDSRNLSRFTVLLPEMRYDTLDEVRRFYRELEDRVRAIPGVESAGSVWGPPFGRGRATGEVEVAGRPKALPGEEREAAIHSIGPGYLETMRTAVVRGRGLTPADDRSSSEPVALVSETFARENFPSEDPLGREVTMTVDLGYGSPAFRIVGVVENVRSRALENEPGSEIYVPHGHYGPESMTVVIRSAPGIEVLPAVRSILRDLEPVAAIHRIETMDEVLDRQIAPMRFHLALIAVFATVAAVLAAVGIYGVVAYAAASRTRELGLRLALGAERGAVSRLMLLEGMKPALLGMAIGLAVAALGGEVMQSVLFSVHFRDPSVLAGTGLLLGTVALAATLLPARRASRIDPVRAIRFE
jgi:predicted permease